MNIVKPVTFFIGKNNCGKSVTARALAPRLQMSDKKEYSSKETEFINKWMEYFEGASKVIHPLLVAIVSNSEPVVWIEHPENGLYPMWQSYLANLFLDAYDYFGTQFIIETHSEYMLKRSSIIVKALYRREKVEYDGIVPYEVFEFFSEEENLLEDSPRQIHYGKSGRFEEELISGLYDESAILSFQLL